MKLDVKVEGQEVDKQAVIAAVELVTEVLYENKVDPYVAIVAMQVLIEMAANELGVSVKSNCVPVDPDAH